MSDLNLLLLNGYEYCPKCLSQIREGLLSCPNCLALKGEYQQQEDNKPNSPPAPKQTSLFNLTEYPV